MNAHELEIRTGGAARRWTLAQGYPPSTITLVHLKIPDEDTSAWLPADGLEGVQMRELLHVTDEQELEHHYLMIGCYSSEVCLLFDVSAERVVTLTEQQYNTIKCKPPTPRRPRDTSDALTIVRQVARLEPVSFPELFDLIVEARQFMDWIEGRGKKHEH